MTEHNPRLRKCDYVFDVIEEPCSRALGHPGAHMTKAAWQMMVGADVAEQDPDEERGAHPLSRRITQSQGKEARRDRT